MADSALKLRFRRGQVNRDGMQPPKPPVMPSLSAPIQGRPGSAVLVS